MSTPNNLEISYPKALIDKKTDFPKNHVIPCSVLLNNNILGGLFIVASNKDLKTLKVAVNSPISFPLNFRMLNIQQKDFLIEICLLYHEQPEKYVRLHLNPHDPDVVKFLTLCLETKFISFHFYDLDNQIVASAFTTLDEVEIEWLTRNLTLAKKLSPNPIGYNEIRKAVESTIKPADRLFKYYTESNPDFFVREGGLLAGLK